jgi:hypothetical protein
MQLSVSEDVLNNNASNKDGVLLDKLEGRDNIDNSQFFREYMTINEAHEYNKKYM